MAFKASPLKKGVLTIHGLEAFVERFIERKLRESRIDERIGELRQALKLGKKSETRAAAESLTKAVLAAEPLPAVPAPKSAPPATTATLAKVAKAPKAAKKSAVTAKKSAKTAAPAVGADPLAALLAALDAHPKKSSLVKAGKQKDQLLRSLIPLYVNQKVGVEVSSGVTSKFWEKHGVHYAAPNAAKALREHAGYSKRTAKGNQITAQGVKYVDDALKA